MGTSKSNRKRRKMTGSKSSGFEEVRVDNKRNLESMRAQKMDNDSGVYSEWLAQQRTKITEGISWSIEESGDLAASAGRGLLNVLARSDRCRFGSSDASRGRSHPATRVSHNQKQESVKLGRTDP